MMPMHDPLHAQRLERERRRSAELARRVRESRTSADGERSHRHVRRPR